MTDENGRGKGLDQDNKSSDNASFDCSKGMHDFPDQNFAVGPRICELCGASEY